jgi:hypothetical protein
MKIFNKTQIFNIPFLLEIRKEKECKEKAEEYKEKAEQYEEKMKKNPYYYLHYWYYNKKIEACNNIQQHAGNKKQYRKIKNTNRIRSTRRKYLRKTKKNKHCSYSKQKQYIQK